MIAAAGRSCRRRVRGVRSGRGRQLKTDRNADRPDHVVRQAARSGPGPADRGRPGRRQPVGRHRRRLRHPELPRPGRRGRPDYQRAGADLLFAATQHAVEQLTGSQRRYPPLTWTCPQCGQRVTDRAASGRPVHVEHGHGPGCARLARDQAADDERRREQVPCLILHSEPAVGPVQRHWLRERVEDDCQRCGWHGYFHHYLATIDGGWAAAVCDNCYADLHPGITVRPGEGTRKIMMPYSRCWSSLQPTGHAGSWCRRLACLPGSDAYSRTDCCSADRRSIRRASGRLRLRAGKTPRSPGYAAGTGDDRFHEHEQPGVRGCRRTKEQNQPAAEPVKTILPVIACCVWTRAHRSSSQARQTSGTAQRRRGRRLAGAYC